MVSECPKKQAERLPWITETRALTLPVFPIHSLHLFFNLINQEYCVTHTHLESVTHQPFGSQPCNLINVVKVGDIHFVDVLVQFAARVTVMEFREERDDSRIWVRSVKVGRITGKLFSGWCSFTRW